MTTALHVNNQSPLAALVEAVIATIAALATTVAALPKLATTENSGEWEEAEERVESWQVVRDLHRQFRSHALLLSRVLHVAVYRGSSEIGLAGVRADAGIAQLQCAFDYNGYYSQRRQGELEASVLSR